MKSLVLRWKLITYHMKLVMGQSIEVDYGKMDIVIPPPRSLLLVVAHLPLPPESGLLIQGASWSDEVDCCAPQLNHSMASSLLYSPRKCLD